MNVYLDYAATTPVDKRVLSAMHPFFNDVYGNPSSTHRFGRKSSDAVEHARVKAAELLNAKPSEIVFTGSGTESDNTALISTAFMRGKNSGHIITSAIEHHAVLHTCEYLKKTGCRVSYVPVDGNGLVGPDDIEKAICKDTFLISIMHANNEIGTVQPIDEICAVARKNGILFHTDAVQTAGHLPIDVQKTGIDFLSLSAHKFYGPKGTGALYVRQGSPFEPFIHGGAQENSRRASTLNVAGIVGLGKAAEIAAQEMDEENIRILGYRERIIDTLFAEIDGIRLNGHRRQRLANNINISIEGVEGESMLLSLDTQGIAVSSGSACSAGSGEPSHVLKALGLSPEQMSGSLRISLGRFSTTDEIEHTIEMLKQTITKLRSFSSF